MATRRRFLQTAAAGAAATLAVPYIFTAAQAQQAKSDRRLLGCIGTGDRWDAVGPQAMSFADCVAVCDVDAAHAAKGKARALQASKSKSGNADVAVFEDYRKILDRKDIDVVTIVTPDHWHSKIAIEAIQAGKDVYCEKPLTLTIEEGQQIRKVLEGSKQVFQVGTQQRSEMSAKTGDNSPINQQFLVAVWLARNGRLGKIKNVQCAIGGAPTSPELPKVAVPKELNWDLWLGQAPMVEYVSAPMGGNAKYPFSRTHYEFRWWYEYSGGKMTDWGAHHVDIATWAIGAENGGPTSVKGTATHPVPFEKGYPTQSNRYNAATNFKVTCQYADGVELLIRDDTENGITIEGTEGNLFVSRGRLTGTAVEALKDKPIPAGELVKLYKGKQPGSHMKNFFDCIADRTQPISDVATHHRAMTTCHLANIAIRLGRELKWDPKTETILGDEEAAGWVRRAQRKGYEIKV